jgi:hypothetical protein
MSDITIVDGVTITGGSIIYDGSGFTLITEAGDDIITEAGDQILTEF